MAKSKDTYWFSHDYNSRNDIKIKKLIDKHGFAGYGLFWAIIEELYNNDNVLSTDYKITLSDRKAKPEIIKSIVEDFELFVVDGEHFGSTSVESRLNERNSKSDKARDSANLRWKRIKDDANALRSDTSRNAIKDSIGKDRGGLNAPANFFTKPTREQVRDFMIEISIPEYMALIQSDKFIQHYTSNGWMVGRNKMKDWKATVHKWKGRMNEFTNQGTSQSVNLSGQI